MKLFKTTLIAAAVAATAIAGNASAATATGSIKAKIVITEACSFGTSSDVDFGSKARATAGNIDLNGTLVVNCTSGTTYDIGLSAGTYAGATVSTRRMSNASSSSVPYALYREAGRTNNWGNTVGTDTVSGTGNGNNQNITVYGRVLASDTNVAAGSYTDTITATITY